MAAPRSSRKNEVPASRASPAPTENICRSPILHSNSPTGWPPRRLLIYPPHREAEWRFCASGPERGNLSAAKAVLRSSATTGKQLIRVHIRHLRLSGIWSRPCGSGLARDGSTSVIQIERGACIAGKPGSHRGNIRPPRRLEKVTRRKGETNIPFNRYAGYAPGIPVKPFSSHRLNAP